MNILNLMQMMRGGGDPMQVVQTFARQNPEAAPAMNLIRGKTPQQLEQTFYNLCKSRGVNPQDVANQCGITLPK